ncbi:aspartate 1-decarboxylase [Syntrophaceticus schinkii]|jgi:aspartate 1-decarboxylase|uniref:Aspartate 1-decarboxylase n=1 Tax=Syntrophaceticus schinkii TaxID=499207 RepID=A0A0B7MN40_9FIRM|nr:aspartate 1-decarboxylase [Syntrophaceticus schinkii]MDD4262710.1 aspartate 1-decarboxylase [Syntrophaceticus schinkii]CEO89122.1 aspartate 1-decarboxylase [Syntrophaceticus schinkii]
MYRCMLKSKIHRAVLTDADLNYMGSITIDRDLLEAADILPFEKVQVVNNNNGQRFETYAIEGEAGSGCVCLNGAAARLGQPGDILIILSYIQLDDQEARQHKPQVVFVDENNKIA